MTKLVGILNITPDSFSDGGQHEDAKLAIARLERLFEEGADMVDIGAESTRPGATPLSAEEEWRRLEPLFAQLKPYHTYPPLSLDTRHAANAKRALDTGFTIINDVSGFAQQDMINTIRGYNAGLVMMHSLSVPADKNVTLPDDADVMQTLIDWADAQKQRLETAGIDGARIIFDPGIGFGKTAAQSLHILENIRLFASLDMPLYVGHSRKSCLGEDRDMATLQWSEKLMAAEVDYLRVHDIAAHKALQERMGG